MAAWLPEGFENTLTKVKGVVCTHCPLGQLPLGSPIASKFRGGSAKHQSRWTLLKRGTGDVHGWKMSPTWYVTVEVHKRGVLPKQRSPRLTTTFDTEAEAKDFAHARLQEGLVVFAGTINPHLPRQLITSHDIAAWVAEGRQE